MHYDPLQKRLGALFETDLDDQRYALRSAPRMLSGIKNYNNRIIDQGETSQCVGYGWNGFLWAGSITNRKNIPEPKFIYDYAQDNDEWDGREPDYYGTSVRAGAKACQHYGYLGEYNWGYDLPTIVNWVLKEGPIVAGTIWTDQMFTLGKRNFLVVDGEVVGGHCYLIVGVNTNHKCPDGSKGAFVIANSWGKGWGSSGRARLSFADWIKLNREGAEWCCSKEIKK